MEKMIYKKIAPYYDTLMKGVNYKGWIEYIKNICILNSVEPKTILDLGCGTGQAAFLLLKEGYEVIGIDGSLEMLKVAKQKLSLFNPSLIQSKFDIFFIKRKVDMVISLFDSLNNLLEENELFNTFACVRNILKDKGIFVFDMNTIYGLSLLDNTSIRISDNIYSIWQSQYDKYNQITTLHITLFISDKNECYKRIDETHKEKGYSLFCIKSLLKKAGFKKSSFYEHPRFRRATSRTKRVMVVAGV